MTIRGFEPVQTPFRTSLYRMLIREFAVQSPAKKAISPSPSQVKTYGPEKSDDDGTRIPPPQPRPSAMALLGQPVSSNISLFQGAPVFHAFFPYGPN